MTAGWWLRVCVRARAQEVGRAVHMAFFVWTPSALLTSDCDQDVRTLCLARRPNMHRTPGAVGTCLATVVSVWAALTSTQGRVCRALRGAHRTRAPHLRLTSVLRGVVALPT